MAPPDISSTGPITIGTTTIATLGWAFSPDVVRQLEFHSGLPYATIERCPGGNPRVRFRCYFADIYALTGLTIVRASVFNVYLSKYTDAARDASATHGKLALAASCAVVIQILGVGCEQDGVLIADVEAVVLNASSTADPLGWTNNNSLPALTAAAVMHTLGPLSRSGSLIRGLGGAALGLNPTLMVERTDGNLFPVVAAQLRGEPRLGLAHRDPRAVLAWLGITGDGAAVTIIQYFLAYNPATGKASSANGVSLTIAAMRATPLDLTTEPGAVATQGVEIVGLSSSTTHPVVVSTSATVPDAA